MNILVFGSRTDVVTTAVLDELQNRSSAKPYLIDCDDHLDISIDIEGEKEDPSIHINGEKLPTPDVFWARTKVRPEVPNSVSAYHGEASPQERYLRFSEWRSVADGLARCFEDISIQKPSAVNLINPKLSQQLQAKRAGFSIYSSSVLMGKHEALRFANKFPNFVVKALGFPVLIKDGGEDPGMLVTTAMNRSNIEEAEEHAFTYVPTWLQEQARCGQEYRIIAIGQNVFSYEIQDRVEHRVHADARLLKPGFKHVETTPRMKELCQNFLSNAGLTYGVFDVILESEGDIKFLECNPEGQWHSSNDSNYDEVVSSFVDLLLKAGDRKVAA